MMALNFAILKYFMSHDEADADEVMAALKNEYGRFRSFKKDSVIESLMTAESNGLLDETKTILEGTDNLRVYYRVNDYGREMIDKYVK